MKSAAKQSYGQVSQTRMAHVEPAYWLRLLGERNGVNAPAGFSRNGYSGPGVELQAQATQPKMVEHRSAYWLRLLGGSGQTNHPTNGRVAKLAPQRLASQQFTPEHWLRLLGQA